MAGSGNVLKKVARLFSTRPVNLKDSCGTILEKNVDGNGYEYYVYNYTYTTGILLWKKKKTASVYIYINVDRDYFDSVSFSCPNGFNKKTDLIVADFTNQSNPNMLAFQAHKVKSKYRDDIIDILLQYDEDFDTPWDRPKKSLLVEWKWYDNFSFFDKSACDMDFDNA